MLMAFFIWILGLFGVAPTDAEMYEMELKFGDRGHHIGVEFSTTRIDLDGTFTWGFNYEYYIPRHFNGVSVEAVFTSTGDLLEPRGRQYYLAGGIGYWPVGGLKLYMQMGAIWFPEDIYATGRFGIGYRFPFFHTAMMPFAWVGATARGDLMWGLGFRGQY